MARTNKYAADCVTCGARVVSRSGVLERGDTGRWEVRHFACSGVDPSEAIDGAGHDGLRRDTDGVPMAYVNLGYHRKGWRRGYEHTGYRCEDAPCCGCCD